jgi:CheY-specific phosphatase CheX
MNMTQEFKKTDLNESANAFDLATPATPGSKKSQVKSKTDLA